LEGFSWLAATCLAIVSISSWSTSLSGLSCMKSFSLANCLSWSKLMQTSSAVVTLIHVITQGVFLCSWSSLDQPSLASMFVPCGHTLVCASAVHVFFFQMEAMPQPLHR
jgi:hypothetical protein